MDPEELFRKIFGNAGFGGFGFSNQDYEGSSSGFAPASEVSVKVDFPQSKTDYSMFLVLCCPLAVHTSQQLLF